MFLFTWCLQKFWFPATLLIIFQCGREIMHIIFNSTTKLNNIYMYNYSNNSVNQVFKKKESSIISVSRYIHAFSYFLYKQFSTY